MGKILLEVVAKVGDSVKRAAAQVEQGFKGLAGRIGGLFSSLGSKLIGGLGLGSAIVIAEKLVDTLFNAANAVVQTAKELEEAREIIRAGTHDMSQFEAITRQLQEAAAQTNLSFKQTAEIFGTLSPALGDTLAAQVTKALAALGDASQTSAQDVAQLAQRLNRTLVEVIGGGAEESSTALRLLARDMARYPGMFDLVAQSMGLSFNELVSGIESGKVSVEDLINTLAKMEPPPASYTIPQLLTNIKETLALIFADIGGGVGILDPIKQVLADINSWLLRNRETIAEIGRIISVIVSTYLRYILENIKLIGRLALVPTKALLTLGRELYTIIERSGAIPSLLQSIQAAVVNIKRGWDNTVNAVKTFINSVREAVKRAIDLYIQIGKRIWGTILFIPNKIIETLRSIFPAFDRLVTTIKIKASEIIAWILEQISNAINRLANLLMSNPFTKALGTALKEGASVVTDYVKGLVKAAGEGRKKLVEALTSKPIKVKEITVEPQQFKVKEPATVTEGGERILGKPIRFEEGSRVQQEVILETVFKEVEVQKLPPDLFAVIRHNLQAEFESMGYELGTALGNAIVAGLQGQQGTLTQDITSILAPALSQAAALALEYFFPALAPFHGVITGLLNSLLMGLFNKPAVQALQNVNKVEYRYVYNINIEKGVINEKAFWQYVFAHVRDAAEELSPNPGGVG